MYFSQIIVFIVYASKYGSDYVDDKFLETYKVAFDLTYKQEAWRYLTYMFVHKGLVILKKIYLKKVITFMK